MPPALEYETMKNSGIEWIGAVPSHWNIRTLYQLVSQVKNKNSDLAEQNLLSLSYGKIKRKDINSTDGLLPASFDGYNIIEAGDIVLRLTDLQNDKTSLRVGLATERGIITSAYVTLHPFDIRHSKYLYYLLHAFDIKKGYYGMGAGVRQGLNYSEVKELRVTIPSFDEMDVIVSFLDVQCTMIDTAIVEAKASIEDYKKLKPSIVFDELSKGEWQLCKLKYFATICNGKEYKDIVVHSGGYPVMGSGGEFARASKFIYDKESVLYGRKGTINKPLYVDFPFWSIDTMFYTIINDDVFPKYLWYASMMINFDYYTTSTAIPSMTQRDLGTEKIPAPPYREQKVIAANLDKKFSEIDSIIATKEQLIIELFEYKQSLIYEVITGKRKVV